MGKTDLPKQFLMLGKKPILVHTIEQFIVCNEIDNIIVAVPDSWINYTLDIINKYCKNDRVTVIAGGQSRNETILNYYDINILSEIIAWATNGDGAKVKVENSSFSGSIAANLLWLSSDGTTSISDEVYFE